jgi:hypothetical protein
MRSEVPERSSTQQSALGIQPSEVFFAPFASFAVRNFSKPLTAKDAKFANKNHVGLSAAGFK